MKMLKGGAIVKQADIESIAYEVVDYFREQEVRKMIQAIEEAPNIFVQELEKLIGGDGQ
jgi:hypothetical protein